MAAEAFDNADGTGALALSGNGLVVGDGPTSISVTDGSASFSLAHHMSETINATGETNETLAFASGFGHNTITGLLAGGRASDVIQLNLSMFSGLSSSNTPAENLASLLLSGAAAQSGSNVTITNSAHDVLTLVGLTTATLSHNAGSVLKFV